MDRLTESLCAEPSVGAVDESLDMAARVSAEFAGALTADEISRWLLHPNEWLDGAAPADACAFDKPAVLAAARADRWVAIG
jgi:hypothetical protein